MKAGRNDPCPCGSGKKYKKCCLGRNPEDDAQRAAVVPSSLIAGASSETELRLQRAALDRLTQAIAAAERKAPARPPRPRDPIEERANAIWNRFQSLRREDRKTLFLETLEDADVMCDEFAFEALNVLRDDDLKLGDRARFAESVGALRERKPEVFEKSARYYLSWLMEDALAEDRRDAARTWALELAAYGRDIDIFNRAADVLQYHGELAVLVDARRIAWPGVKSNNDIFPWAIRQFADQAAELEILHYLEHTASPRPDDPVLRERIQFFLDDPHEDFIREFVADVTAASRREWKADDFDLGSPKKRRRDEWDDDYEEESPRPRPGVYNLSRLTSEFLGYLHREEGVPFPRAALFRDKLHHYFRDRHEGDLDPRLSMFEAVMHPNRKRPKPPPPAHPLCPERVTLEVNLARLMAMMSARYHAAAALFLGMPAWLRFLENRRLIDAGTHEKVLAELVPLHSDLLRIWKDFNQDPLLYQQGQEWPGAAVALESR
jgi:hypothetical protein